MALAATGTLRAQIGVGAGIAAVGDNVMQATGAVGDLINKENISASDISGDLGFYVMGRYGIDLDPIRLIGDASYVYFPASTITLTDANAGTSSSNATFEVGTTFIPIAAGATIRLPSPVVKPYGGAQLSYTYVKRTYTYVSGDSEIRDLQIQNKDAGDPEMGLTVNAGVEFDLGVGTLDIGARYNMMNLFTTATNEKSMRYLQVGALLAF